MEERILETERLLLRPFQIDDWQDLYEYLSIPDVLHFEPSSPSDIKECQAIAEERSRGMDFWAVCLVTSGKMIGHVYFAARLPCQFSTWELGYIFNPDFWHKGYATEACGAIVSHGFRRHNAHRVVAACNPKNTASWRLLERLGFRREAHFRRDVFFRQDKDGMPDWQDSFLYAVLADEWQDKT